MPYLLLEDVPSLECSSRMNVNFETGSETLYHFAYVLVHVRIIRKRIDSVSRSSNWLISDKMSGNAKDTYIHFFFIWGAMNLNLKYVSCNLRFLCTVAIFKGKNQRCKDTNNSVDSKFTSQANSRALRSQVADKFWFIVRIIQF